MKSPCEICIIKAVCKGKNKDMSCEIFHAWVKMIIKDMIEKEHEKSM